MLVPAPIGLFDEQSRSPPAPLVPCEMFTVQTHLFFTCCPELHCGCAEPQACHKREAQCTALHAHDRRPTHPSLLCVLLTTQSPVSASGPD
jgi:hypothetical protein